MNVYLRFLLAAIVFSICTFKSVEAQVVLERVSITERADGRGFVIRNHLSLMPDSFQVVQPAENRIQFVIYSEGLESENFIEAVLMDEFEQLNYFSGPGFFAYEITLREGGLYLANAYPDVNQTDVLLALERVESSDLTDVLESGLELFEGEPNREEDVSITEPERSIPDIEDSDVTEVKRISATFGIKSGITSADIYGAGYERNPRSGITIAATAVITFPASLPFELSVGLDTGLYFTQKGFTDPTSTKFTGIEVEFDYIEIPVLLKLNYRKENLLSPHIILGPYLGFLANAENVREDGDRSDLDEFTRTVDFGGMAGIGVDLRLDDIMVDLQIRQSLGFNTLFDEITYDDDEKLRQLSLVLGFRF